MKQTFIQSTEVLRVHCISIVCCVVGSLLGMQAGDFAAEVAIKVGKQHMVAVLYTITPVHKEESMHLSASVLPPDSVVLDATTEKQPQSVTVKTVAEKEATSSKPDLDSKDVKQSDFPVFGTAVYPVTKIPNWSSLSIQDSIKLSYDEIPSEIFIPVPRYDTSQLTIPLSDLDEANPEHAKIITQKLFYSTRHFGAYNLDADEFTSIHPGVDLKLPFGTPIGSIAGGRVFAVEKDANLGRYIVVEHRHEDLGTMYSIYGHVDRVFVHVGQDLTPGFIVATVGMTGSTTAPHLHLQIDRQASSNTFTRYWPNTMPSRTQASRYTHHPMQLIARY